MRPVLARVLGIDIHAWGFFFAVAFVTATIVLMREARRKGLDGDAVIDLSMWILISSLLGARLLYVILEWKLYQFNPWEPLNLTAGGLSFRGGLFGGVLA